MRANTYGELFQVSTFGESHGKAVGVVIDGCPAGIEISEEDIQKELDKRKPGQSLLSSLRKEDDIVEICSGTFEGRTTGTPILLIVHNTNQRSKDYSEIKDIFRPGHADFTYFKKYGIRDYRGGGRSSARETVGRVAAGAIAKKILSIKKGIEIFAYVTQVGDIKAENFEREYIDQNHLHTCDREARQKMEEVILAARQKGDSVGAIIELTAKNVPIGLGEPIFDRLNARLAYAILSIPAVKGIEFGAGFAVASRHGSENNDEITKDGFLSNNAGGTLGGISNGDDIVLRFPIKPTSSILIPRRSIDINNNPCEVVTKGRHDPCLAPRACIVAESMVALTLLDMLLLDNARHL